MQSSDWNLVLSGQNSGEYNMMLDEVLARRLVAGSTTPILRLYQWKPWAISLGYNQDASQIDIPNCRLHGIDVVRRPTGGRAILHAEELTYSVVMPAHRKGVHRIYNEISGALVEGLRLVGVDVSLQKSQPNFSELYKSASSVPCFSSSARYEIEVKGRKLVGSAQRKYSSEKGDVVLQHGSILCGPAHRRLADYLNLTDLQLRMTVAEELERKTTDLSEATGLPVDVEWVAECVIEGFRKFFDISFTSEEVENTKRETYV
jgi:lipoyl(octanoyl) transferase